MAFFTQKTNRELYQALDGMLKFFGDPSRKGKLPSQGEIASMPEVNELAEGLNRSLEAMKQEVIYATLQAQHMRLLVRMAVPFL